MSKDDLLYMGEALQEARKARDLGEVPVGAVLVHAREILSRGHNEPIRDHDPTAHAEIKTMRLAAQRLGNYRLTECRLYVTLEPCLMCAGAMIQARLAEVVFGAPDEKNGVIISRVAALDFAWLNHTVPYRSGVMAEESRRLLQDFFQERRRLLKEGKRLDLTMKEKDSPCFSGK